MRLCTHHQLWLWSSFLLILFGLSGSVSAAEGQGWERYSHESTLEVLTIDSEGEEHWSTFWLVVLDGQCYLRLGTRGAERIERHTKQPHVSIKIAGQRSDQVLVIRAPEMAEAVAAAMAEKYWSDLYVRYFPHPMTVRLEMGE